MFNFVVSIMPNLIMFIMVALELNTFCSIYIISLPKAYLEDLTVSKLKKVLSIVFVLQLFRKLIPFIAKTLIHLELTSRYTVTLELCLHWRFQNVDVCKKSRTILPTTTFNFRIVTDIIFVLAELIEDLANLTRK